MSKGWIKHTQHHSGACVKWLLCHTCTFHFLMTPIQLSVTSVASLLADEVVKDGPWSGGRSTEVSLQGRVGSVPWHAVFGGCHGLGLAFVPWTRPGSSPSWEPTWQKLIVSTGKGSSFCGDLPAATWIFKATVQRLKKALEATIRTARGYDTAYYWVMLSSSSNWKNRNKLDKLK